MGELIILIMFDHDFHQTSISPHVESQKSSLYKMMGHKGEDVRIGYSINQGCCWVLVSFFLLIAVQSVGLAKKVNQVFR